MVILLRLDDIT